MGVTQKYPTETNTPVRKCSSGGCSFIKVTFESSTWLYISKEEWKSYDGFCIVEDVVFLFNNCKHCNIISKKENPMPLKVYPDDAKICQNGCQWFYEYRNGKLKLLKRL